MTTRVWVGQGYTREKSLSDTQSAVAHSTSHRQLRGVHRPLPPQGEEIDMVLFAWSSFVNSNSSFSYFSDFAEGGVALQHIHIPFDVFCLLLRIASDRVVEIGVAEPMC